jgi:3-mercaptopyruvate sulfurtransferase SseA
VHKNGKTPEFWPHKKQKEKRVVNSKTKILTSQYGPRDKAINRIPNAVPIDSEMNLEHKVR